jgi:acyl dehydratase
VYRSTLGRTVTETDNVWFTNLTLNTNQAHFNTPFAERSRFGRPLVNSTFTLALVTGLSVPDVSQAAVANLSWDQIEMPNPVFVGDTLWAESEVLDKRESRSRPEVGVVKVRTRGLNQRGETVIEFRRTIMVHRRSAAEQVELFPESTDPWHV